jgi:hypothetical protein
MILEVVLPTYIQAITAAMDSSRTYIEKFLLRAQEYVTIHKFKSKVSVANANELLGSSR